MPPRNLRRGDPEKGCAVLLVAVLVFLLIVALAGALWITIDMFG